MNNIFSKFWIDPFRRDFSIILSELSDMDSIQKFLSDIMTEKEITEVSARLQAARMLTNGRRYDEIISETKLSSRTVARISKWLKIGYGGYSIAISKISKKKSSHIMPACVD